MDRKMRIWAIGGMWVATAFAGVLEGTGVGAQEVVDLPAEDLPLLADFELVYRIGSTGAVAEWEQFSTILGVGFDAAGSLYLLDGTGARAARRGVVVDTSGRHVRNFGRPGEGPGEFRRGTELIVWRDGRTLVGDMTGYHVFAPNGEFERVVRETDGFGVMTRMGLRSERTECQRDQPREPPLRVHPSGVSRSFPGSRGRTGDGTGGDPVVDLLPGRDVPRLRLRLLDE